MGSRKERLKNSLGISEYPWSSDDDENETNHTNPLNLVRRQAEDAPRPSLGEVPGTSGPPLVPSATDSATRNAQAKVDRQMFWALINNRAQARSRAGESGMPSTSQSSRLVPPPSAERREPRLERSSTADVQRIIARWKSRDEFLRFTKSLRAMRNSRHNNTVYPVYSRNTSGPSRNPLFNHSVSADMPIVRTNMRHIPKRLYNSRPDYSSLNRRPGGSSSAHAPRTAPSAAPLSSAMLAPVAEEETFHVDLSDDGGRGAAHPRTAASAAPLSSAMLAPVAEETFHVDLSDDELETTPRRQPTPTHEGNSAAADMSVETLDDSLNTSGGTTSDEPAPAPAQDSVDGPDRLNRDEVTEPADAVPSTSQHSREKRRRDECDDNEPSTVKEFNQNLLRLLECPVCLEWMEPPIAQCRRGHLVCTQCRARLAACPVCRTTFSSVRNRAMEGVSELLRYPCRHGCGREVRLRRRTLHESSCTARKYQCPAAACAQRPPLAQQDLAHHFQSKHLDVLKIGRKHKFSMKVNSEQHDDWLIMALHELFHLRVDVDVRNWGVVFYVAYIGPKANAKNFTYSITINGPHQSRKLSYVRVTHSDLDRSLLNVNRTDCFHLTLDQALNFLRFKSRHCDPDKYLDFNVEIAKTEDDEENKETQET